jgi:hypothetical protein
MRVGFFSTSILALFVNLTAVQAQNDTHPNGLKTLELFVGDCHNGAASLLANRLPICRKRFVRDNTARVLKNSCILGRELSQPGGSKSSYFIEAEDAKNDSEKIRGAWAVVTYIQNGEGNEKLGNPEDSILRFYFSRDKVTIFDIVHGGIG